MYTDDLVLQLYMYPFYLPFSSHPGNKKMCDIRKAMRRHMELLSAYIAAGVVAPVECYYFSLPTARAHTSHKVPEFPQPGGWGYCMHRHS